jgi:hypothetical protein
MQKHSSQPSSELDGVPQDFVFAIQISKVQYHKRRIPKLETVDKKAEGRLSETTALGTTEILQERLRKEEIEIEKLQEQLAKRRENLQKLKGEGEDSGESQSQSRPDKDAEDGWLVSLPQNGEATGAISNEEPNHAAEAMDHESPTKPTDNNLSSPDTTISSPYQLQESAVHPIHQDYTSISEPSSPHQSPSLSPSPELASTPTPPQIQRIKPHDTTISSGHCLLCFHISSSRETAEQADERRAREKKALLDEALKDFAMDY